MTPLALSGTAEEMVHPGGELAFIRQMIRDSQALGGRIHWYTSMCGKKATLKVLRRELHDLGVTALRTTELAQVRGHWCCWSGCRDAAVWLCMKCCLLRGIVSSACAVAFTRVWFWGTRNGKRYCACT